MKAGRDFTVREYNPGIQGEFQLYHIDTLHYDFGRIKADLAQPENRGCFLVCDFWFPYHHRQDFMFLQNPDSSHIGGIIYTWNEPLKFYKAYGERVAAIPTLWTLSTVMPKDAKRIRVNVENHFYKDYATDNVVAKIVGRRHDSCFVFTAHYDHLGNLGRKVYYGGANDNASGTAAIITLKYLFNIDMIGDNNPELHCEPSEAGSWAFPVLEQLNRRNGGFRSLKLCPLEEKSDHYPFAVRGVPCIFFENEEGEAFPFYHTPQDDWQHVRFDTYLPLFRLVTDFVKEISQ